jgi:hypothetical protein
LPAAERTRRPEIHNRPPGDFPPAPIRFGVLDFLQNPAKSEIRRKAHGSIRCCGVVWAVRFAWLCGYPRPSLGDGLFSPPVASGPGRRFCFGVRSAGVVGGTLPLDQLRGQVEHQFRPGPPEKCSVRRRSTANATSSSVSSTRSNTFEPSPRARTNSPEIFLPEFKWPRILILLN